MKVQLTFKNKVYDNYQIDENGIIYDMNGNIQETYVKQGRPTFKKISVHRYVMHSFKGYQEGMDVHHLNGDKFDNRLDNLVYLTRSEHIALHSSNRPCSFREKLRLANLGEKNPMYGKDPWNKGKKVASFISEEGRISLSSKTAQRNAGRIWVNNGISNKFVYPDNIPDGFIYKGRI